MTKPRLPKVPTTDDESNPLPYVASDGSVYMPMFGKHVMACSDALLKAYSDPPKKRRRSKKAV